ncbi:MAG: alpha/beta hydrolase [Synechococcales cyanobacterium C42_A2020_086]|jgi:proline iminopeptidase|nr:alpha/beta hydrolase [Synechococcales cyanobacterium C42_A2020_086]
MTTLSSSQASTSAVPLATEICGQGFPILCLHGHPGNRASMAVFTQHLSQRFQTIAPDLRGYGGSPAPQHFQMSDHLLDLEALLDRLAISRALVLGWSLGGILAMELALRRPERVTGLILIATAARPWSTHPRVDWQDEVYTGLAAVLNWLHPGWQWNIDTFGKRSLFRYLIQQHTPVAYQYIAAAAMPAYLQTSKAASRALNTAIRQGYNRLAALEQIQCPTLMLIGEADRHIAAASSLETAQHLRACQVHCYPNVAHLFPWEIPTQVLADIEAWLQQHPQVIAG